MKRRSRPWRRPPPCRPCPRWLEPEFDREFEQGQLGPDGDDGEPTVVREPVGMRGRFGRRVRFEDRETCDYTSTMELRYRGRRHTFTWSGHYALAFGALFVGRQLYFAESAYGRWSLIQVPVTSALARGVVRTPTETAGDFEHVEMEVWYCTPSE